MVRDVEGFDGIRTPGVQAHRRWCVLVVDWFSKMDSVGEGQQVVCRYLHFDYPSTGQPCRNGRMMFQNRKRRVSWSLQHQRSFTIDVRALWFRELEGPRNMSHKTRPLGSPSKLMGACRTSYRTTRPRRGLFPFPSKSSRPARATSSVEESERGSKSKLPKSSALDAANLERTTRGKFWIESPTRSSFRGGPDATDNQIVGVM